MSEMIERVAEAMKARSALNAIGGPAFLPPSWLDLAQAAIEALRLPTEAMVTAGDNADYFCSEGIRISRLIERDGVANVFTAMIDAALNNGEM